MKTDLQKIATAHWFDGLDPTDRMGVFGVKAMVSHPDGWTVWTINGDQVDVPSCVGHWLANRA